VKGEDVSTIQSSPAADEFEAAFPAASLEMIRQQAPEAYDHLRHTYGEAYRAADPMLLELARLRIALMVDPHAPPGSSPWLSEAKVRALADWTKSDAYTPVERACLAFAEQFAFYVADVNDGLIEDLLALLDPDEVYGLVNAIYVVDTVERLRVTLARVFDGRGDSP
jgi:alkylhydroperoxidase family enzyme